MVLTSAGAILPPPLIGTSVRQFSLKVPILERFNDNAVKRRRRQVDGSSAHRFIKADRARVLAYFVLQLHFSHKRKLCCQHCLILIACGFKIR